MRCSLCGTCRPNTRFIVKRKQAISCSQNVMFPLSFLSFFTSFIFFSSSRRLFQWWEHRSQFYLNYLHVWQDSFGLGWGHSLTLAKTKNSEKRPYELYPNHAAAFKTSISVPQWPKTVTASRPRESLISVTLRLSRTTAVRMITRLSAKIHYLIP